MELYDLIESLNPNQENILLTCLDAPDKGRKILFSDRKCLFDSMEKEEDLFLQKEVLEYKKQGLFQYNDKSYYAESLGSEKHIVICGGGHVSMPVITLGIMMGFKVTVIEDRPSFADNARRQGATQVICDNFEHALEQIEGNHDTYFVIVTRGHRYDKECLRGIINKPNAYVGMIGSRRRVGIVKKTLEEEGYSREKLEGVFTPIGLNIGAETPEEIGIAIMAEIIQVKNSQKRNYGFPGEIKRAIRGIREAGENMVLATIIHRQGSAPREVGTKMLIRRDGSSIGTIGGGCVEADVMLRGRRMLQLKDKETKVIHVDLRGSGLAEEDGMVCGGIIDVLLEYIE